MMGPLHRWIQNNWIKETKYKSTFTQPIFQSWSFLHHATSASAGLTQLFAPDCCYQDGAGGRGGVGGPSEGPEDNIVCYLSSHSWNQVTQKHICNLGIAYLLPFREKLPKVGWKRRHDSLNIVWWIIEKTEIILSKLGKSQKQLTWLPICGSIYSYHSKCHILHSFKSKCYFRNFRSSPAEQRGKVKVTRGEKEGRQLLNGGHGGVADLQIWEEEAGDLPG